MQGRSIQKTVGYSYEVLSNSEALIPVVFVKDKGSIYVQGRYIVVKKGLNSLLPYKVAKALIMLGYARIISDSENHYINLLFLKLKLEMLFEKHKALSVKEIYNMLPEYNKYNIMYVLEFLEKEGFIRFDESLKAYVINEK